MLLKAKLTIIILIQLSAIEVNWSQVFEKEYFVIGKNTILYELNNGKANRILTFNQFDKVKVLNLNPVKNQYYVSFNGTNGWVNISEISFIPDDWIKFTKIDDIIIYLPKNFDYKYEKGNRVENGDKSIYIESKLYDKQYFTDINNNHYYLDLWYHTNVSFIESEGDDISNIKKINYNGNDGYFRNEPPDFGGEELELIIDKEIKREYYQFGIGLSKLKPTEDEELTAMKILFSVRIKDTSGSNEQPSSEQTGQTYILTGDNVNVRAEAATNGAVLVKLSKGAKVTLLKRSDTALTVGDKKGFWAYVDTQVTNKDGESIKGWVFDYYLKEDK